MAPLNHAMVDKIARILCWGGPQPWDDSLAQLPRGRGGAGLRGAGARGERAALWLQRLHGNRGGWVVGGVGVGVGVWGGDGGGGLQSFRRH